MKIKITRKLFSSIALTFCLLLSSLTVKAQIFSADQQNGKQENLLGALPSVDIDSFGLNEAAAVKLDDYPKVSLTGTATLLAVIPGGAERFSFQLQLKNQKPEKVQIIEETVFLASRGGWSRHPNNQSNWISNKIGSKTINPSATHTLNYESSAAGERTASYVYARLRVATNGKSRVVFLQIPIVTPDKFYKAPLPLERLTFINPVFIGVQEPVRSIHLSNGKYWLQIAGQVINLTGLPAKLISWKATLQLNGKVISTSFGPDQFGGDNLINPFFIGKEYTLAENAESNIVIEAEVQINGVNHFVMRDLPMKSPMPVMGTAFPVKGHWNWGNGVGDPAFHGHYRNEDQRFAYDMGMFKSVNGKQRLYIGVNPGQNASYFCWNQPIYSIADGKVVAVIDNFPENDGNQPNPATGNNMVVVEHETRKHTVFVHIRPNSAVVSVGQTVKAGDKLASVGNAGSSSAPHLHMAAYWIDETGHINAIPMMFKIPDFTAFNMSDKFTVPKGTNGIIGFMTD